jgi:methylmalonyl-CoA/ethylmalonyl-CoA epimerase
MSRPHVDHIGIIVPDLKRAIAAFAPLFANECPTQKSLPEVGLLIAEFQAANIIVELIQFTSQNTAFARETMGDAPGLNHISMRVDDVPAAITNLAGVGFEVQSGFPMNGAHGEVAFFKRHAGTGVLVEVCKPHEEPAPGYEFEGEKRKRGGDVEKTVPATAWEFRIALKTGGSTDEYD